MQGFDCEARPDGLTGSPAAFLQSSFETETVTASCRQAPHESSISLTRHEPSEQAMPRDFTLQALRRLYTAYRGAGYAPMPFVDWLRERPAGRCVVLRHDVDRRPGHALRVAELQHAMHIRGTYYIRIVPSAFDPGVVRAIHALGHEIGYHYEDVALCRGDLGRAAAHFEKSLARLRELAPVKTLCMHGSPLSKWDNRLLWRRIGYRDYGLLGEPYFDADFSRGLYLTDTGRCWNGDRFSLRDRMKQGGTGRYKTTFDIAAALEENALPAFVMQTFHPQRWMDGWGGWTAEWIRQSVRNTAKVALRAVRG
jgi:hypothetical protein